MKVRGSLFTHCAPDAMAGTGARTCDAPTGTLVQGKRTSSTRKAVYHAIELNGSWPAPCYFTRDLFGGEIVERAFTDLVEFIQEHGLDLQTSASQQKDL
jgi:hypothetical protein